ncbi:MAG: phosphoglucosamine mutase [Candidatus Rokubacteria bacterium]|nr:phosphoglucosamine mutase [Candidatus Rokubacteria bacterium]MBI2544585.1 phosphoglucosamine mutase [Candidatus Rokubacteria bacterium]
MTRLFGTDGIRGVANQEPLTPEMAYRLGREIVATLLEHEGQSRIRLVIGRDTRLSGPLLEAALVAGALSAGAECYTVGVLPTPAVAFLTRHLEAHGGIVLSASHNPFEDNGIKVFSPDGTKLPDAWEDEIEARLAAPDRAPRPHGGAVGRLVVYDRAEADYLAFCRRGADLRLDDVAVALDCAHGATYRLAPRLFRGLGARVVALGVRPDGTNINRRSGALYPEALQKKVKSSGAQIGLGFDGDGDRLITVDEAGEIRDGDYVLAICARHLAARGQLKGGLVVTTVMANLGLDRSLAEAGIRALKTQVGDRYVLEEMRRVGANLGGEQSGHLIFLDRSTTGDGLISALQLLAVMKETGRSLGELSRCLTKFPQVLLNVEVREKPPLDGVPGLAGRLKEIEASLDGRGRILVRYSGTEPLARVMLEGEDRGQIETLAREVAGIIKRAIGSGRPR